MTFDESQQLLNLAFASVTYGEPDVPTQVGPNTAGYIEQVKNFIFETIGSWISGLIKGLENAWGYATGYLGSIVENLWTELQSIGTYIYNAFARLGDVLEQLWNNVTDIFEYIGDIIAGAFGDIWDAVTSVIDAVSEKISEVYENIKI